MCLTCSISLNKPILPWDPEEIKKTLSLDWNTIYIHTHANTVLPLTQLEIEEIKENAVALIAMGIEGGLLFIWAIQWPNDYKPIYF